MKIVDMVITQTRIDSTLVQKYEQMIDDADGEWPFEPVTVSPDGELLDGNHRVEAAMRAGIRDVPVTIQEE